MEPKARHIVIGFFVVGITIFAMLFTLWLMRVNVYKGSYRYVVYFKESVSGLSRGSAVEYSGVKVGEVLKLALDYKDPRYVYAVISVKKHVPIRSGVIARLQMVGITGQLVVSLSGGDPSKPLLVQKEEDNDDEDDPLPIIRASPSPLSDLLEEGHTVVSNLMEVATKLSQLLSDENIDNVGHIIQHIEKVTHAVASKDDVIKGLVHNADSTLNDFRKAVNQVNNLASNANAMLTKEGKEVLTRAANAMSSLAASGKHIQKMLSQNEAAFNKGMQGFKEVSPAMVQFKEASNTLQHILKNMEDDPMVYFINGTGIKEFTPNETK